MPADRHAVILSGSIGRGHHMMAAAVAEVLDDGGWSSETLDCLTLLGGLNSRISAMVTRRLMATPGLHDAVHYAALRPGSRLAMGMSRLSDRTVVPQLRAHDGWRRRGLALSVFATGAAAAAALGPADPGRPSVVLCTDVSPHRLWVWPGTDLFLVTSRAAELAVRRYQPHAHVEIVAAPVRRSFFDAPDRAGARRVIDVPDGEPCVLLLDSGWGFGPRRAVAESLAAAGVHVLAVAGRDVDERWTRLAHDDPRVHVYGATDDVPLLMSAADLVVALPGATICGEARAMGRPLMLLDLMPGHGRDNLQHELDLGDAWVCDVHADGMTRSILAALDGGLPTRARSNAGAWPSSLRRALGSIGVVIGTADRHRVVADGR